MNYLEGHVKRSPDGVVAIRSMFADEEPTAAMAWIVVSTKIGARHTRTTEVDSWDDLFTPEAS